MQKRKHRKGSVIIIVVFAVALMSTLVVGILQANTEELQLMQNHVNSVTAYCIAEAGLNDAFVQLREDSSWREGFSSKQFDKGTYTVSVTGDLPCLTLEAAGRTEQGYTAKLRARITVGTVYPHMIRSDLVERVY